MEGQLLFSSAIQFAGLLSPTLGLLFPSKLKRQAKTLNSQRFKMSGYGST